MNATLVKKSKWFWQWQDDREEAWLGEMSRQGLHLVKANPFARYVFAQGEPKRYAYRLDFVTRSKRSDTYFQLFRDAGWEYVGEMMGWQYWRKEIVDGKVPEIFTDTESKIQKYRRLLGFLVIFIPIFLINVVNYNNFMFIQSGQHSVLFTTVYNSVMIVMCAVYALVFFSIFMVSRRISALKRQQAV